MSAHSAIGRRIDLLVNPLLCNWCNKGRGMYYSIFGMVYINVPLLLIGNDPHLYIQSHVIINNMLSASLIISTFLFKFHLEVKLKFMK